MNQIPHAKSWSRRKQARPGEILDAALKVFAEKGFAAARMEDIAARAGVTKGTIYLYFHGKEEVFKTLVREYIGGTLADVAQKAAQYDGSLRDFLSAFYGIASAVIMEGQRTVLPKIIIAESGNFPELARFYREEVIDRAFAVMGGVIERAMERDEVRRLPVRDVVRVIVAPLVMSIIWRTTFAPFDTEAFDYRRFFATHIEILFGGLAPEGNKS
jgi:AcrR family transcriptional regulator